MRIKKLQALLYAALLLAFIIVVIIFYQPDAASVAAGTNNSDGSRTGLMLNEAMAQNSAAVLDNYGNASDWVEIYNSSDSDISLSGYFLSDTEGNPAKYPLPAATVPARGYIIVYCSGTASQSANAPLHAGFRLNREETVCLFYENVLIDSMALSNSESNQSLVRENDEIVPTALYTPGFANDAAGHDAFIAAHDARDGAQLLINEIQSANASTITDGYGAYSDWMELINISGAPIDLTGYYITNDAAQPFLYRIQGGTIQPGETFLIFCSGKASIGDEQHAPFKLSADGLTAALSDKEGKLLDQMIVPELSGDASYGREAGDYTRRSIFPQGTPNLPNTTQSALINVQKFFDINNKGLYINEAMASNTQTLTLEADTPDWLELHNATGGPINLDNYALSDNLSRKSKWVFPVYTLENDSYVLVYLSGLNKSDTAAGVFHTNFKLDGMGETLILSDGDRNVIDKMIVPHMGADISIGRSADATGFFYYTAPTPGAKNPSGYLGIASMPLSDNPGGIYQQGLTLNLSVPEGMRVYYTTDASIPTPSSTPYSAPIAIDKTTVIRARAFGDNMIDSSVFSATYLVGETSSVPIMALVTEPDNLFGHENGIFANGPGYLEEFPHGSNGRGANFWMDWERPVHVEYFKDGKTVLTQDAGVKLNGQYSRAIEQKSMAIYARTKYSTNSFEAALFDDREYTSYKSFVLRSTAQDYNRARMRDAMLTSLVPDELMMHQHTQVVDVYINGTYWGHYNLRERVNKYSVAQYEGVTDESVVERIDIIKGNSRVLNGSNTEYRELIEFVKNNSLTNSDNLKYVTDRVDVQNYFDYQITEMYFGNSDNGNIKFYKVPGGKWKWILYDVDWAANTGNSGNDWNVFEAYLNKNGTGVGDAFETVLFWRLLENADMKALFFQRIAYLVNNFYTPEIIDARIDEFVATMTPQMQAHYDKWPSSGSVSGWEKHVDLLRTYYKQRPTYFKGHMKSYFNLSDAQMNQIFGN